MVHQFIEFGGILFWIIVGVVTLILAAQVNEEKTGYATLTLLVFIAALVAFSNTPVLETIKQHPIYVLYGLLAYFGISGLWAFAKWRLFYLPNLFDQYDELRTEFLKRRGLKEMPADPKVREDFAKDRAVERLNISYFRMVRHNKGRITSWMVFWPFSLIGTFLGDFLHRVFTTIYKTIAGGLQRMSDNMASRYSELD